MIRLDKAPSEMDENEIAAVVIEISFQIHRKWGPGLLEKVYEALLVHHLRKLGFEVKQQPEIPFEEDGVCLDVGFRADIIVENRLIVELKSVEKTRPVFYKILLTYLRLTGLKLGLLINFGEALLKDGIKRVANGLQD
ncbi:MAG: GxxExxY protein [Phaeodactylibacter sp.]|nr:GxxExxY protein [Phaeodactylibacter sp.]